MPWQKILYSRQEYPDNFSGPEFLAGLQTNVTAEKYSLQECVVGSLMLAEEVGLVALFALLFSLSHDGSLHWQALLAALALAVALGAAAFLALADAIPSPAHAARTAAVFLGFGYGMSPLLRTLTATISTDTIYAMAAAMFLLSLVFHDYGVDVSIVSPSFALNGRLFGAVCLVSRLHSADSAFALLALAVALFALWPPLRRRLAARFPAAQAPLRLLFLLGVLTAVLPHSAALAALYSALLLFISLLCPYWLVRLQHIKATIHGPWDEAVIHDTR